MNVRTFRKLCGIFCAPLGKETFKQYEKFRSYYLLNHRIRDLLINQISFYGILSSNFRNTSCGRIWASYQSHQCLVSMQNNRTFDAHLPVLWRTPICSVRGNSVCNNSGQRRFLWNGSSLSKAWRVVNHHSDVWSITHTLTACDICKSCSLVLIIVSWKLEC